MSTKAWELEPDSLDFTAHGFQCALRRGPGGHWCGYVGIPATHPLHKVGYSQRCELLKDALERRKQQPIGENPGMMIYLALLTGEIEPRPDIVFEVHGGLTYAEDHEPHGKPDGLWWFGFDCAHSGDLSPKYYRKYDCLSGTYRDINFAKTEAERLAEQLAAVQAGGVTYVS